MKTLVIAWLAAILLYSATSIVNAQSLDSADFIKVWDEFSEGSVCITILDKIDHSDATAELWLVSSSDQGEVTWLKDVKGYSCINMDADEETELHLITYDPRIIISVVLDDANATILARL